MSVSPEHTVEHIIKQICACIVKLEVLNKRLLRENAESTSNQATLDFAKHELKLCIEHLNKLNSKISPAPAGNMIFGL